MRKKENKVGAHCPLCNTPHPHTDDPIVSEIVLLFADPASLTLRSLEALADLRSSIISDISERRFFAWQTRLRQIEEIYIKALYCVFFADRAELPHIFSGREPNSILRFYRKVNEEVFEGRGTWESQPAGGARGALKPLDILHGSAHASYFSIFMALAYAQQQIPTTYAKNWSSTSLPTVTAWSTCTRCLWPGETRKQSCSRCATCTDRSVTGRNG